MTTSPLLPLTLRLNALEAQVHGFPSARPEAGPSRQRPITRRLTEINETLDGLCGESEALKRLLSGYQGYLPLLSISGDVVPTPSPDDEQGHRERGLTEADLLPDETKVTMSLEAASDIRGAERDLREIEVLRSRGLEGSGSLEELLSLRPNLRIGFDRAEKRGKELERSRKEVSELLRRYAEFTSTVSELFISLHRRMEGLEEDVARMERKRRKEVGERF